MSQEPVVIYSAANSQQAHLLKGLLEDQGIWARVVNDAIQIAGGELPLGWTAAPRVIVRLDDAEEARRLAEEFDQQTSHEPTADSAEAAALTDWSEWPVCPTCGERRSARCSVCGSSGNRFGLADILSTTAGEQVLLKCEACDDLFQPEWYRLCPHCGHDFGTGIITSSPTGAAINAATLFVLVALLAGGSIFVGYFFWLFS
jgi:predicted RNA-binding Zn-ribbon protein involved in translation (DUF1610 family)